MRRGPVFSEFAVSHPFANGNFATRIRLYAGVRRIEIQTRLVNNEHYVRYQALFPTSIQNGRNVQEIPFGAVERPIGIEFPAQSWVDYCDGRRGVALLNFGLPGNLVTDDGTMILSLMRSHNLGHYGFGGGYEPGMSSETGFELARQLTFRYALVPHQGDWRQAAVYRDGMEFNRPLLCQKVAPHGIQPSFDDTKDHLTPRAAARTLGSVGNFPSQCDTNRAKAESRPHHRPASLRSGRASCRWSANQAAPQGNLRPGCRPFGASLAPIENPQECCPI